MLARNIIYSFTQSFIELFPALLRSCQMYKFCVVPPNFLCLVQIIQLTYKCSVVFHRVSFFSLVCCSV